MQPQQFEAELSRIHAQSFAWAVRCCRGDRIEAEDVLHLTYAKVLDGRARFEARSSFKTWLFGVIRRTAFEEIRRGMMHRLWMGKWWREREHLHEGAADQVALVVESERRDQLRQALGQLSPRQQEVLHLVFYQDLTIQEAATVLKMQIGTARTHYERGKARLRQLLDREGVQK